ncbi:MAG: pantoate--beta-alanine ligase [Chloroflexota bacterium]
MQIIKSIEEMQSVSGKLKAIGKTISFVPTMGYLHEGHAGLIKRSRELADVVIASVFVNPTQFGPNEDFDKYPRDLERDSKIAESAGCDYLFHPTVSEMYPRGFGSGIIVSGVTEVLEGEKRPGHFDGVALVVAKLFNAVMPDIAVFGQKDYQQTLVIKKMVRDLNFPIKIVIAPTVREATGLAMSSRNSYLDPTQRERASIIFHALEEARKAVSKGTHERKVLNAIILNKLRSVQEIKIDYVATALAETLEQPDSFLPGEKIVFLVAAFFGRTRLIDNALATIPDDPNVKKFVEGI